MTSELEANLGFGGKLLPRSGKRLMSQPIDHVSLDPRQASEIIVPGFRGSGYRIKKDLILTAAHVVAGAAEIVARFNADQHNEWTSPGETVFEDEGIDVAVLRLKRIPPDQRTLDIAFGQIENCDGTFPCSMLGFPRSSLRRDRAEGFQLGLTEYRDALHVVGLATPWSNTREGTLAIQVPPPERSDDAERSPWEGMSGAAVWSDGKIVAVVTQHHRSDGLGRLTASRVDQWYSRLQEEKLETLHQYLSMPDTASGLPVVPVTQTPSAMARAEIKEATRALMVAQIRAADRNPYRHLDPGVSGSLFVEPRLSRLLDSGDSNASVADFIVNVIAVGGVSIIVGSPGIGKTRVTQQVTRELAEEWMNATGSGSVLVPVRVLARDLATAGGPLSSAIRESVIKELGLDLHSPLPNDLFDFEATALRWLIIVDGLDEIGDYGQRQELLRVIAGNASAEQSKYQWLLTTRGINETGMDTLRGVGASAYRLEPFNDYQLKTFVAGWLGRDDPAMLQKFRQQQIDHLVRIPLLAAIATMLFQSGVETPAGPGRIALYKQFVGYLTNGRAGEDTRRRLLEEAVANSGGTPLLAAWMYTHRLEIVAILGGAENWNVSEYVSRSSSTTARRWVNENAPEQVDFVIGIDDLILAYAASTGLIVHNGKGAVGTTTWLHRTFADYLVGRRNAASLPRTWRPDDQEQQRILSMALDSEASELAILTLSCWSDRSDVEPAGLFQTLLQESQYLNPHLTTASGSRIMVGDDSSAFDRHIVLAAEILAAGGRGSTQTQEAVLFGLLDRIRSMFNTVEYARAIASLPNREIAWQRLREFANDPGLQVQARSGIILAIGLISGPERAIEAADSITQSGFPGMLTIIDPVHQSVHISGLHVSIRKSRGGHAGARRDRF